MADSDALRSKRKRLHAAGDCRLCRHDSRRVAVILPAGDAARVDARASLEALARRLEAAHEADPADAAVARELRVTLLALPAGDPGGPGAADDDDPLADLRALAESVS